MSNPVENPTLLIIAGGTGGHIFPAMVVGEEMQKKGVSVKWMGTQVGMEKELVGGRFPMVFLPVKAIRGKNVITQFLAPFRLLKAVYLAMRLIKKINPTIVLGMGGYASGPGGIAAWLLRKPLIIHEQNAVAGLTNRVLSRVANTILSAFPGAFGSSSRAVIVGNPVRQELMTLHSNKTFDKKPLHLLILGGSQGANAINKLIMNWCTLTKQPTDFLIWHVAGRRDFEGVKNFYQTSPDMLYRIDPFLENMKIAYDWADLVIGRSGALTVSEIAAMGLPSILIPYPHAADDHQYSNACFLANAQASIVYRESELTAEKLNLCLQNLISSPQQLQAMADQAKNCAQPQALSKITAQCLALISP